jgi:ABC-type branched-subunit amino acid transport system ATPase component
MTTVLQLRDGAFCADGITLVRPTSLEVQPAECVAHLCANAREAEILAMIAGALVRVTSGTVYVGEYDPRIQPVHCKRLVGYVPHDPLPLSRMSFERYVEYRAALWDLDARCARARAHLLLERLAGVHEAFAYPIVGALLSNPPLLVLDRPPHVFAPQILAASGDRAIFSTHVDAESAAAFAPRRERAFV